MSKIKLHFIKKETRSFWLVLQLIMMLLHLLKLQNRVSCLTNLKDHLNLVPLFTLHFLIKKTFIKDFQIKIWLDSQWTTKKRKKVKMNTKLTTDKVPPTDLLLIIMMTKIPIFMMSIWIMSALNIQID